MNYEWVNIQRFLNKVFFNLERNGILAVISFHSGEDRIISNVFSELEKMKLGKNLFKKQVPSKEEIEENSKSHSAILRAFKYEVL